MKTKGSAESEQPSVPRSGRPSAPRTTGKITHDSRGNAVWEWGVATGVFNRIKTTELLNLLEDPTLSLEGERALTAGEWSGDPYNRR